MIQDLIGATALAFIVAAIIYLPYLTGV